MTSVNCVAETCKYYSNGVCGKDEIFLDDLEYFKTLEQAKKNDIHDDIRCTSYISIHTGEGVKIYKDFEEEM